MKKWRAELTCAQGSRYAPCVMHTRAVWLLGLTSALMGAVLLAAHPVAALCPGDCNGDGLVQVDEVVRSVNLALGVGQFRFCPPADSSGDGTVTVDEILQSVGSLLDGCPATVQVYHAPAVHEAAGPRGGGRGVLPNGRRVDPAGVQIPTQTLPLNLALTPDGRSLLVTNDGYSDDEHRQFVQVVDTQTLAVTQTEVPHFFGLGVSPGGDRVFVANDTGAEADRVESLRLMGGVLTRDDMPLAELPKDTFPSGLAVSPDGKQLYALGLRTNRFYAIDTATGAVHEADSQVGNMPYAVVLSADGTRAYVSSWGWNNGNPADLVPAPLPPSQASRPERSSVAVLDLSDAAAPHLLRYVRIAPDLRIDNRTIMGASHPSAMALSPDGKLLYVTATNIDLLAVVDTDTFASVAEVPLNTFDDAPVQRQRQGLYPNALAVSPDGRRVYVADAGINAVQVVQVDPVGRTFTPAGFIPTGWYPSALALSADGKRLFVANGKGAGIGPNGGAAFDATQSRTSYIAQLLKGSVSVIDAVDAYDLEQGRAQVIANNGLAPATVRWTDGEPGDDEVVRGNPVPIDFGSGPSSQIKYVVFILKENRTYDQVLGELPEGDGDPDLAFFGGSVTPNQQALARQFASGDNFYDDGEVSTPGHEWIDQANCNDFTEKMWPSNYDRTLPSNVLEQGQEGFAKGGFMFQALERQGVTYRVYGETLALLSRFAAGIDGGGVGSIALPLTNAFGGFPSEAQVNAMVNGQIDVLAQQGVDVDILRTVVWPNLNLDFPLNILPERTDVERAAIFKTELATFSARGDLPTFIHIWLPNDHTFGARAGSPTTRSAVADNDAGLGLIVEALTNSPFWPQMAIFVTEDDAQDGQDHVSAHRTISLVISPYVKHGYVSHVHQSNVGMSKTMALLLGVQAMSEYDRHATDMRDYFTATPDFTPYTARPRAIPVEINPSPDAAPNSYLRRAAVLSADLDLEWFDEAGAGMSRVIELVYEGQRLEAERTRVVRATLLAIVLLLGGAVAWGRRRARVP
jgi:DNA-binding beta-propeller fold protein YncE